MSSTAPPIMTHQPKTPSNNQLQSQTQVPPTAQTTSTSTTKSKSKPNSKHHSYITPKEIDRLSTTFFNPNFRPPRRPRIPSPPSLRGSLLPPPCAEIDERPRWRVRRLVLWRDRVPPLRVALLDPRKRIHLKRFQGFVTPEDPDFFRGVRSVSGVLRSPTGPTPQVQSSPVPSKLMITDPMPQQQQQRSITPYPSPPPPSPVPAPEADPGRRMKAIHRLTARLSSFPNPTVPYTALSTSTTLSPPLISTTTTTVTSSAGTAILGRATPRAPRAKSTMLSRKLARARVLQHSLILHREEEKRWRTAMGLLVTDMQDFVKSSTCVLPGSKKLVWIRPIQIPRVNQYIKLMKDIRESSKNLWTHLPNFLPRLNAHQHQHQHHHTHIHTTQHHHHHPHIPGSVKGLKEAKVKVKGLEEREERKRQRKVARLALVKAKAAVADSAATEPGKVEGLAKVDDAATKSDVRVAIRGRATPATVITQRQPSPGLSPSIHTDTTSTPQSGDQRREAQLQSQSQSPKSDRIITPLSSHRHASPEWTRSYPSPVTSGSENSTRTIRTPKFALSLGVGVGRDDDEIARHLAEMLTNLKRLGAGQRQKVSLDTQTHTQTQTQNGDEGDHDWTGLSARTGRVTRHDPAESSEEEPDEHDQVPDLEVPVYSEDSEGSEFDGIGQDTVGQSMEAVSGVSWVTGELNVDDDTKAAVSGIGGISTSSFV